MRGGIERAQSAFVPSRQGSPDIKPWGLPWVIKSRSREGFKSYGAHWDAGGCNNTEWVSANLCDNHLIKGLLPWSELLVRVS